MKLWPGFLGLIGGKRDEAALSIQSYEEWPQARLHKEYRFEGIYTNRGGVYCANMSLRGWRLHSVVATPQGPYPIMVVMERDVV